jgi:hypothetical protein
MDCRTFRRKHLGVVDVTLPGVDTVAMREHVSGCTACARLDRSVRRSLMVARSLPPVHVSADFRARLMMRLRSERGRPAPLVRRRMPSPRVMVAVAAGLATAMVLAREVVGTGEEAVTVRSHVEAPAPVADAPSDPMLVAAVSSGVPVWPALMIAQDAPINFARVQFRESDAEY